HCVQRIESLRDVCRNAPLPEQIDHMLAQSGLSAHYQKDKQDADRLQNLNELINAAAAFATEADDSWLDEMGVSAAASADSGQTDNAQLAAFLAHAALEAGEHQAGNGQDALQLMTVHAAKGLEFNAVFVSGLEDGLFPHENSRLEADGLAEERRLLYVAITRARRRLTLSFSQSRMLHGQMRYNIPSRFLEEIPASLIQLLGYAAGVQRKDAIPAPRRAETDGQGFRIGQNVRHPKFGEGMIIDCEGRGADTRVRVKFGSGDPKWLALEYAKLAPV
ncbi:MAG TPA: DNA helicase II, partial [Betaproteobacteria bacterium]|nr:DNA helicase II [Betaproteobacteria bacterium]